MEKMSVSGELKVVMLVTLLFFIILAVAFPIPKPEQALKDKEKSEKKKRTGTVTPVKIKQIDGVNFMIWVLGEDNSIWTYHVHRGWELQSKGTQE